MSATDVPGSAAGASAELKPAKPGISITTSPPAPKGTIGMKLPQETVKPAPERAPGMAKRCTIDEFIAPAGCGKRKLGDLLVGADGFLYVVENDAGVRRYSVALTDEPESCSLKLDRNFGTKGLLPNPKVPPMSQKLDGKVYLRSGGPEYSLARKGDAVYMTDFSDGMHTVIGAKAVKNCRVPGVSEVVFVGKKIYGRRSGKIVRIKMTSKGCQVVGKPFEMGDSARVMMVWNGALFAGGRVDGAYRVTRWTMKAKRVFSSGKDDSFAEGGFCSITGLVQCGQGALCVIDGNCRKISQLDPKTGEYLRRISFDDLFAAGVYGVSGADHAGDGALWAAVSLRGKGSSHDDRCEPAIFRLAPSASAPSLDKP